MDFLLQRISLYKGFPCRRDFPLQGAPLYKGFPFFTMGIPFLRCFPSHTYTYTYVCVYVYVDVYVYVYIYIYIHMCVYIYIYIYICIYVISLSLSISLSRGASERLLKPPKAVPFQTRPVTSWNGLLSFPRVGFRCCSFRFYV